MFSIIVIEVSFFLSIYLIPLAASEHLNLAVVAGQAINPCQRGGSGGGKVSRLMKTPRGQLWINIQS